MNVNYPGKVPTEQLAADHAAGLTVREIARKYGNLSFQAVADRLKRAGYDLPVGRRRNHKYEPRICPTCEQSFQPYFAEQVHCQLACKRTESKEYCKNGHRLTPGNLTPWSNGRPPRCRLCYNERMRRRRRKT